MIKKFLLGIALAGQLSAMHLPKGSRIVVNEKRDTRAIENLKPGMKVLSCDDTHCFENIIIATAITKGLNHQKGYALALKEEPHTYYFIQKGQEYEIHNFGIGIGITWFIGGPVTFSANLAVSGIYLGYMLYESMEKKNKESRFHASQDTTYDTKPQVYESSTNNIKKQESPIWKGADNWRGKYKYNGKSGKERKIYDWDYTHGDIEVYDHRGDHEGSIDPVSGKLTKPAVPGRTCKDGGCV